MHVKHGTLVPKIRLAMTKESLISCVNLYANIYKMVGYNLVNSLHMAKV